MSWGPPHNPYEHVPERYKAIYPPEEIQLRPNAVDTPATRKDLSGYYAHITALDENLGRLMRALDEIGIADDTILVYTSDTVICSVATDTSEKNVRGTNPVVFLS